ncbi:translation elongation factor Tu [Klebsiella grimontii]|uniref:Translation elongation factor Tu n=1 Tax=Klebsiella grimontii TaxID=2058152 RepID=A0A7H4PCB1_9ENTR|nr:translation elongation factor Tu [Klebsiella grimontii]
MSKEKFERTKPHVNVGTIGHVDHGKTTLTLQSLPFWLKPTVVLLAHSIRSITRRKKKLVVSPSTRLTLNMTPRLATTRT